MKRQIDHFLLGLLWLLALALGANFWFNTKFGFNIFSGPHWDYLGQLQAARIPVNTWFYISMVVVVFVMLSGLYLLIRPKFRKIRMSPVVISTTNDDASEINIIAGEPVAQKEVVMPTTARPPRLNLGHTFVSPPADLMESKPETSVQKTDIAVIADKKSPDMPTDVLFTEIQEIFESASYSVKKPPRLGGFRPALFAIGANESLWIGGIGIEPAGLTGAVEKLQSIFTDTLQDIQINIHPFIVMPKSQEITPDSAIETFDSMADLRSYMNDHKNTELTDAEKDDFNAYSEYIDTVTEYLNNG